MCGEGGGEISEIKMFRNEGIKRRAFNLGEGALTWDFKEYDTDKKKKVHFCRFP